MQASKHIMSNFLKKRRRFSIFLIFFLIEFVSCRRSFRILRLQKFAPHSIVLKKHHALQFQWPFLKGARELPPLSGQLETYSVF